MAELNVMTTREVSEFTGLAMRTLRRYVEEGRLKICGYKGTFIFHRDDVLAMLAERAKLPAYRRQNRRTRHADRL